MSLRSNKKIIDFSFIPSLECNIECPFCMYSAGPNNKEELDFEKTKKFINTINWDIINSIGFYGGEPSINLPLYQKFIDLIPFEIPKFIITNGAWSSSFIDTNQFIHFLEKNEFFLIVSGTPYHKKYQNIETLKIIKNLYPDATRLKGNDIIHPMGRASKENWSCSNKCLTYNNPTRLGLFPNGDILFQNCDGVYPIIQTYLDSFDGIIDKVDKVKLECINYKRF